MASQQTKALLVVGALCVGVLILMGGGSPPASATTRRTPAKPVPDPGAACRQSLQCWGDKHLIAAGVYCQNDIENLGQYAHEWTDAWHEKKMERWNWLDEEAGTLTYFGDKITFQNAFGASVPHWYFCEFDPQSNGVISVGADAGRLPSR